MKSKKSNKLSLHPPAEYVPEDDPYWVISPDSKDPNKGGHHLERLNTFLLRYPFWVNDLMCGVPTYYAVLGVLRGATSDELRGCYEREMNFSVYPDETIEEAFRVLSDLQLRVKYDELLHLFKTITAYSSPSEKENLTKAHSDYLKNARNMRKVGELQVTHHDYIILVGKGMPDIFEYSKLSPDCTDEEILRYSSGGDELSVMISSIMHDPHLREKFVFVTDFFENMILEKGREKRERLKKVWGSFSPDLLKRVILLSLTKNKAFGEAIDRINKNLSENHDWKNYLPPSEKSFLSLFGVEKEELSLPKEDLAAFLRSKYRLLKRTSEVNLAYTVLKNPSLRDEYLWMREYYDFKMLDDAIGDDTDEPDPDEPMEELFEKTIRQIITQKGSFF